VAACLAQAEARRLEARRAAHAFRGGMVLPAATAQGPDPATEAGLEALAERARAAFSATVGLAVGPSRPGPEGRSVLAIGLAIGEHVEVVEHMLGGGPTLALSRAAKTAVDLVRRTLAVRNPRA
jgi:hypothetical protein